MGRRFHERKTAAAGAPPLTGKRRPEESTGKWHRITRGRKHHDQATGGGTPRGKHTHSERAPPSIRSEKVQEVGSPGSRALQSRSVQEQDPIRVGAPRNGNLQTRPGASPSLEEIQGGSVQEPWPPGA